MDVKIRFFVKFCSRYTYPEVCTTKNHENRGQMGIKIDEQFEKIDPGVSWNAQKLARMDRIDRIGCTSGQWGEKALPEQG